MKFPAKGSLSDARFIEILKDAASSSLTGMIRLENGSIIKVIYLQKGSISFASSNEKSDRLTEVLKRAGKLTPEQVQDAQTRLKPNVSLGKTLVELGYISAKDLLWGARAQVDGILHHLLFWSEGKYQLLEGTLPKEIIHLNLSVPLVIFEGILKTQNRDWILQHIGSPEAVYALSSDFEEQNRTLKLPVSAVVSKINGKRSLHDLAQGSGIDTFELCKTVVALEYLDLARPIQDEPLQMALTAPAEVKAPAEAIPESSPEIENQVEEPGDQAQVPAAEEIETPKEPAAPEREQISPTEPVDDSAAVPEPVEPVKPEPQPELTGASHTPGEQPVESLPISIEQPPSQLEEESISSDTPKKFSRKSFFTILLIAAAVGAVVYYFFRKQEGVQPGPAEQKITQEIQKDPKLPPPETPAVIDSTEPVVPPPSDAVPSNSPANFLKEGKIAQSAKASKDLLKKNGYTIQLVIACQEKTVLETHRMLNYSEQMIVLPLTYKGQNCYRVLFGQYSTPKEALAAIKTLPESFLRQSSPAGVVTMARVLS